MARFAAPEYTMPPLAAVREPYGALIDTTPAADTAIGALPVIAPPPEDVTQVGHVRSPVVGYRTSGPEALTAKVPEGFGRVSCGLPAVACAVIVAVPPDPPANHKVPCRLPGTPRTGVADAVTVLSDPETSSPPAIVVAGEVAVDHAGGAVAPDWSIWRAVAVPARIARLVGPE